jgi:hypothetical protein
MDWSLGEILIGILVFCAVLYMAVPGFRDMVDKAFSDFGSVFEDQPLEDSLPEEPPAPAPGPLLGSRLIGVKSDNKVYIKEKLDQPWLLLEEYAAGNRGNQSTGMSTVGITNPPPVNVSTLKFRSAAQLQSGEIVGLTTDNKLYTRANLSASWEPVNTLSANSIPMSKITQLSSGMIIGISRSRKFYTKTSLNAPWVYLSETDCIALEQLSDGRLLGIRESEGSRFFSLKTNLDSPWSPITTRALVSKDIESTDARTSIPDFAIIKNMTFTNITKASGEWKTMTGTFMTDGIANFTVLPITYMMNGQTSGLMNAMVRDVFLDQTSVWQTFLSIFGANTPKPEKRSFIAIYRELTPSGTTVYRLVGGDSWGKLYVSSTFSLTRPISDLSWTSDNAVYNCCFDDFHQLNDNRMVAIKKSDGLLYTRDNWNENWRLVTGEEVNITQIAVLSDGRLTGISDENDISISCQQTSGTCAGNKLYVRKTITSGWEKETPKQTVNLLYLSLMRDGSQIGIYKNGTSVISRVRFGNAEDWKSMPNTSGVKAICQMADGSFVGISSGMNNGKLVKRKSLLSGSWEEITEDETCCWLSIQNLK